MEEVKTYKQIFAIRKGGENGEKRFITLGNVAISTKLYDTEEEAVEDLEKLNLESVARMLVAIMNTCENMIDDKLKELKK